MEKWADFLISQVSYDKEHAHITKATVHDDNGDKVGVARTEDRMTVVANIKKGKSHCTILKGQDRKWKKGMRVDVIRVWQKEFVRTDSNQKESDNLGELPER